MNRLRCRIPWIIVPLLLLVPMILAACGGLTEEEKEQLASAAEAAASAQQAAAAAQQGVEAIDTEAIVSDAVTEALAQVPEPPPGITADDVSSAISMAIAEIPEGITEDDVSMAAQDAAEQVAAGTLKIDEVQGAIAMAFQMAAAEQARMEAEAEEEARMMAMKAQEERLQQIYAEFFQGQTIRLLVGFSAGGGYDIYGRAIARHIGKHIPGNPEVVVENMTGSGSLIAANFLYNQAEPDGLTMGLWNSNHVLISALVDDPAVEGIQFDALEYGWLGAPSEGNVVCAIMGRDGRTEASEILAAGSTLKHGSTATKGGSLADVPRMTNAFLGTEHKIVAGYRGTARVRLALQGGEVDAACWGWESMSVSARDMLDAEGDDKFIPYLKLFPSDDAEIADLPLLGDFITDPEQKALYDIWTQGYDFQRPYTTPPNTPPELIDVLQQAFSDTMEDPEFLADAETSNVYVNPVSGDEIEALVPRLLSLARENKEAMQFLVTPLPE